MKEIKRDPIVERNEASIAEIRKLEKERFDKALKDLKESEIYPYILGFFDRAEKRIIEEIEEMQLRDMKQVFMLDKKDKEKKIEEMSKRDAILTGALAVLKEVKSQL